MLTDEEIAALSPQDRYQLIQRLSRPLDELGASTRFLRRTRELRVALIAGCAVLLLPWIVYLGLTLPRTYRANHWDATWVGFDLIIAVLLAVTALLGYGRRLAVVPAAFATGMLLVCDAWFDVLTADPHDVGDSLASAFLLELPLAVVLIALSLRLLRLTGARLWLIEPSDPVWRIRIPLPSRVDDAVRHARRRPAPRTPV